MNPVQTYEGKIIDKHGVAIPNAIVSVIESSVPFPEIALLTDFDGQFAINFPNGKFILQAIGHDNSNCKVEITNNDDQLLNIIYDNSEDIRIVFFELE